MDLDPILLGWICAVVILAAIDRWRGR